MEKITLQHMDKIFKNHSNIFCSSLRTNLEREMSALLFSPLPQPGSADFFPPKVCASPGFFVTGQKSDMLIWEIFSDSDDFVFSVLLSSLDGPKAFVNTVSKPCKSKKFSLKKS